MTHVTPSLSACPVCQLDIGQALLEGGPCYQAGFLSLISSWYIKQQTSPIQLLTARSEGQFVSLISSLISNSRIKLEYQTEPAILGSKTDETRKRGVRGCLLIIGRGWPPSKGPALVPPSRRHRVLSATGTRLRVTAGHQVSRHRPKIRL